MVLEQLKNKGENKRKVKLSEKMRVLNVKRADLIKVSVSINDIHLIKRELIRKALLFGERVRV